MKKLVLTLALLLPLAAAAQTTEFGGGVRTSVAVDYKIMKGLHVNLEEEMRIGGAFQSLNRLQRRLSSSAWSAARCFSPTDR